MSVVKIMLWVVGIPVVLVFIYLFYVFFNMAFISQITNLKKSFDSEFESNVVGIDIVEVSDNENLLEFEFEPNTGDINGSRVMTLMPEGMVEDSRRFFDDDPGRELEVVARGNNLKSLLFKDNDVYEVRDKQLANKVGSFTNPELGFVRHVLPISETIMLVQADRADSKYVDTWLWQVDLSTFDKFTLTKDPYFSDDRPPKIFVNERAGEKIVVYYVGDYSFGFGGHSSRPKKSIIRIYNKQFPKGKDLASFAFKAGTIVHVEWGETGVILTGDPSKLTGSKKDRVPVRKWKTTFTGNEF